MSSTEWWQRGPIDGIPAVLQPIAHILLQVRESVGELVTGLTLVDGMLAPVVWPRRPFMSDTSEALLIASLLMHVADPFL